MKTDTRFSAVIAALRLYRLQKNLTYRELADRIGLASHSRLFHLLTAKNPKVNDRTQYQIERFADRVGLSREKLSA